MICKEVILPLLYQQSFNLRVTRSSLKVKPHAAVSLDTRALCVCDSNTGPGHTAIFIHSADDFLFVLTLSLPPHESTDAGPARPRLTRHTAHCKADLRSATWDKFRLSKNKQILRSSASDGVLMIAT